MYRFDITPYLDGRDVAAPRPGLIDLIRARIAPLQATLNTPGRRTPAMWEDQLYQVLELLHSPERGPRLDALFWKPPRLPVAEEMSIDAMIRFRQKLCLLGRGLNTPCQEPLKFILERYKGLKAELSVRSHHRTRRACPALASQLESQLFDCGRYLRREGFALGQILLDQLGERAPLPSSPKTTLFPSSAAAMFLPNRSATTVPYLLQLTRQACFDLDLADSPLRPYVIRNPHYAAARPDFFNPSPRPDSGGPFLREHIQALPFEKRYALQQAALFLTWFLPTTSHFVDSMTILSASVDRDLGAEVARDLRALGYDSYVRNSTRCILETTAEGKTFFAPDFHATLPVHQLYLARSADGTRFCEAAGKFVADESVPFTTVLNRFQEILGITPEFIDSLMKEAKQRFHTAAKSYGSPSAVPPVVSVSSVIRVAFWPEADVIDFYVRQMLPQVYSGKRPLCEGPMNRKKYSSPS